MVKEANIDHFYVSYSDGHFLYLWIVFLFE